MPIIEPSDPLDANPKSSSVRLGKRLRQDLESIAGKKRLSLTEVITQLLKWGIANKDSLPPKDPYDLEPENFSLRAGTPLRKKLEEIAAAKRMTVSELVTEILKLGLREERK